MNTKIQLPVQEIQQFCESHHIQQLAVFGSVLRDDFSDSSDIDLLVTYMPDTQITLLDMVSQEIELSGLIGRNVDLRTAQELSPYFRADVIKNSQVIYERDR